MYNLICFLQLFNLRELNFDMGSEFFFVGGGGFG